MAEGGDQAVAATSGHDPATQDIEVEVQETSSAALDYKTEFEKQKAEIERLTKIIQDPEAVARLNAMHSVGKTDPAKPGETPKAHQILGLPNPVANVERNQEMEDMLGPTVQALAFELIDRHILPQMIPLVQTVQHLWNQSQEQGDQQIIANYPEVKERLPEIRQYARERGLSLEEAILAKEGKTIVQKRTERARAADSSARAAARTVQSGAGKPTAPPTKPAESPTPTREDVGQWMEKWMAEQRARQAQTINAG